MQETRQDPGVTSRIEVKGLFPTPVALLMLPDHEALNAELAALVQARAETERSTSHSNRGGWQSSWDLSTWGGTPGEQVLATARAMASRLTRGRDGRPVNVDWKINAWANINRKGHSNEFHTHPGSFWSGSYYVDDGGCWQHPELGGELELQDPRGVAPVMYAPMLAYASPGGLSVGASELIRPRPGLMVMFPSWLQHAVRPYDGDAGRISIAFNLSV